jgi:hypothetical protein
MALCPYSVTMFQPLQESDNMIPRCVHLAYAQFTGVADVVEDMS